MEPQAPAPPQPQQKKKLGPLAWILIGCLGIIVLVGILTVAGGIFATKKLKDVAENYRENPARAAAELAVRMNPDLELVEADDEAQTLTIRNKKTGEVFTADWSDIQQGKFRIDAGGKKVTVDATRATSGDGGVITMTDESGDATVTIGGGDTSSVPAWFPAYPGASKAGSTYTSKTGTEESRMFTFTTGDEVDDVMAFYRDELAGVGFELTENTFTSGGVVGGALSGEDSSGRTINVGLTRQNDTTQVGVNYTERQQ